MRVAMLGSDYQYGLSPAYSGLGGYVRNPSYLGADQDLYKVPSTSSYAVKGTSVPTWWNEVKGLLGLGKEIAIEALRTKQADAAARGATTEANTAKSLIQALMSGENPFESKGFDASSLMLPLAVGGIGLIVILAMSRKRARR